MERLSLDENIAGEGRSVVYRNIAGVKAVLQCPAGYAEPPACLDLIDHNTRQMVFFLREDLSWT